jgi:DNA-directed RNA polymerase subunit E'/Rpb7
MKKLEFIKDDLHQFVGERELKCKIRRFTRKDILGEITNEIEASIHMKCTCSGFPVQYEGTINGKNAYFRDRHGVWYFEVYTGEIMESEVLFRKEGSSIDTIGFDGMLFAEKRIMQCAIKFAKKQKAIESETKTEQEP